MESGDLRAELGKLVRTLVQEGDPDVRLPALLREHLGEHAAVLPS